MRRIASLTIFSAALLALAACTPPAPAPPAAEPPEPAAPIASVADARRTWAANGPPSYAYTLSISCFCIHRGSYAVEVRDGRIASVRDAASGEPSPESRVEWIVTVDRLFEAMAQAEQAGTPVRATYDARLGHPTEAEIGTPANDAGTRYGIENLRPL